MSNNRGLGKGLGALFGDDVIEEVAQENLEKKQKAQNTQRAQRVQRAQKTEKVQIGRAHV